MGTQLTLRPRLVWLVTWIASVALSTAIAVALIGGGAIGTILQRLPDKDEKNTWKYYAVCFTVMAVIAFVYVTLVDY